MSYMVNRMYFYHLCELNEKIKKKKKRDRERLKRAQWYCHHFVKCKTHPVVGLSSLQFHLIPI